MNTRRTMLKMLVFTQIILIILKLTKRRSIGNGSIQMNMNRRRSLYFQVENWLNLILRLTMLMRTVLYRKKNRNSSIHLSLMNNELTIAICWKSQWKLKRRIKVENLFFGRRIKWETNGKWNELRVNERLLKRKMDQNGIYQIKLDLKIMLLLKSISSTMRILTPKFLLSLKNLGDVIMKC